MSHFVFLRHAETDMAGTFCGHTDPSVNDAGKIQILALMERFRCQRFDVCYSSDLLRAIQTATPIAAICLRPLQTMTYLREIHFGDWEGLTWKQIEVQNLHYARRWIQAFPSLPAPNGETFAAFENRVIQTIRHLQRTEHGKKVLVVTHEGVMRVVLSRLLDYEQQQAHSMTKEYCCSFEYIENTTTNEVRE